MPSATRPRLPGGSVGRRVRSDRVLALGAHQRHGHSFGPEGRLPPQPECPYSAARQAVPGSGSCCDGQCCAPASLRYSHSARAAELTASNCVRCVQTNAASQITKRAAHAEPSTPFLVVTEIAPTGHRPPRGTGCCFRREHSERSRKGASGQAAARLWGAEQRQGSWPRAPRELSSDSSHLFERSDEAIEVSYATGPRD